MSRNGQVFINCDANFIVPLSVLIHSLLSHSNPTRPLVIHLVHDAKFTQEDYIARIRNIVCDYPFAHVEFHDFTPIFERHRNELTVKGNPWPTLVWAFPLFTEILPEIHGNVVYLDADMLVCKDLGELFDLDLAAAGCFAAAVNECAHVKRCHLEAFGWPRDAGAYFNNGTMVVDADAYRREGIADKIPSLFAAHARHFYCVDQDLQNVLLGTRTLRLPMRWNYHDTWLMQAVKRNLTEPDWDSHRPQDVLEATLEPCIIHYIGRHKPWRYTHRPERGVYLEEMKMLGLLSNGLPGETLSCRIAGFFYDVFHRLIKAYARRRLHRLMQDHLTKQAVITRT